MDYRIIKRFYSNVEANIYYLRMQKAGIICFLSNENISTILPLSDGGVLLNVSVDQLEEANEIIELIDRENTVDVDKQDFREANKEDILYEKKISEHEKWLESGWIDKKTVSTILLVLFVIIVLGIVINFFFPFKPT